MEGSRLFRKDRPGRWGGSIALYVSDQLECMDSALGWMMSQPKGCGSRLKRGQ